MAGTKKKVIVSHKEAKYGWIGKESLRQWQLTSLSSEAVGHASHEGAAGIGRLRRRNRRESQAGRCIKYYFVP